MTRRMSTLLVAPLLGLVLALHISAVGADAPCIDDGRGTCVSQPTDASVGLRTTGAEPLSASLVAAPPASAQPAHIQPAWMVCTLPSVDVVPCDVP